MKEPTEQEFSAMLDKLENTPSLLCKNGKLFDSTGEEVLTAQRLHEITDQLFAAPVIPDEPTFISTPQNYKQIVEAKINGVNLPVRLVRMSEPCVVQTNLRELGI